MNRVGWFWGRAKEKPPSPRAAREPVLVRRELLEMICATAQSQHPHEFGAMLRAEKGVIKELLLEPGTISGQTHAIFQFSMLPIDFSVRGTVHSHPGGNPRPSDADLELFRKHGTFHIIIAEPYTMRTWRAYDGDGQPIAVRVVEAS